MVHVVYAHVIKSKDSKNTKDTILSVNKINMDPNFKENNKTARGLWLIKLNYDSFPLHNRGKSQNIVYPKKCLLQKHNFAKAGLVQGYDMYCFVLQRCVMITKHKLTANLRFYYHILWQYYALATRESEFRFLDNSSLFWLIFGKFSSKI